MTAKQSHRNHPLHRPTDGNVLSVTHVTEDDLDDLEFDTLHTGDHTSRRAAFDLADSVSGGVSRAKVLLRAANSGSTRVTTPRRELYQRAVEDGGEAYGMPAPIWPTRCSRRAGRRGACPADEIRADAPKDPESTGRWPRASTPRRHRGAHDWPRRAPTCDVHAAQSRGGLRRIRGGRGHRAAKLAEMAEMAEDSLEALLRLRYRTRLDLGRSEDEYDSMLDELLKQR